MTGTPDSPGTPPSPALTEWVLILFARRMRLNQYTEEKIQAAMDERRAALKAMDADHMTAKLLGELSIGEIHRSHHGPH